MSDISKTNEQAVDMIESHFRVIAIGLISCNPTVPAHAVWEAIAAAMGGVLSGATKGPDIAATLTARRHLSEIVTKAITKRYPAMEPTLVSALPANQNGASVVKFSQ